MTDLRDRIAVVYGGFGVAGMAGMLARRVTAA
jgi:hypothetical protein